jgi:neurotransmitter:Na+ symporter, NSS family
MSQIREHWSSRLGFIMAAAGSAIGLGVLWKFPYTVGNNGGGLFILAYLFCVLFVGIPLFMGELVLGRHAQLSAVGAFTGKRVSHKWKSVGWIAVLASFLIMSYYSVIAGWCMSYSLMSLTGVFKGKSALEVSRVFDALSSSGFISTFWHGLFTIITVGIVVSGVRKGIEQWSKVITKALLIILLCLFFYSISLDGFSKAVHFVFYPDLSRFQPVSVLEALGLAFFTLSLGQGIMITYGSYLQKSEDIPKIGLIIGSMMIVISILAALTIFPVIFTFDFPSQGGTGLIFQTLPYLFEQLPGSVILSSVFFLLFVFCALTSAVPLIEVVSATLIDMYGWTRIRAAVSVGAAAFLFGIPSALSGTGYLSEWKIIYGMDFLLTMDHLVTVWLLPIGGWFTAFFVGWKMDKNVVWQEFLSGTKWGGLWKFWLFFIRFVVPAAVLAILIQKSGII